MIRWSLTILMLAVLPYTLIAEVIEGWQHLAPNNPNKVKNGVLLDGGAVVYSSPAIGEIDGIKSNGLETAVGTADGVLNVVSAAGQLLWSAELPNHKCTHAGAENKLFSSPAIADLFGNGKKYVVVGYGGVPAKECGGGVVAFDGKTGKRRWHFNLKKFSKKQKFSVPISHSVFSSPVIKDINGDGKAEIAFGSFDRNVYVLNSRGKSIWYYHAADTVWSSGSFADANGDGVDELIIGTDISANPYLNPPTENGGYVYAFKIDIPKLKKKKRKKKKKAKKSKKKVKIKLKYYGFQNEDAYLWRTHFSQVIYSAPSIGNILTSNKGLEVAVGSGCFFPQSKNKKDGRWIKILSLKNGKVLKTLESPVCITSKPALGDINADGQMDVVATVSGHSSIGGDGKSQVIAWNASSTETLWSTTPKSNDVWAGHFSSANIADLDGDGNNEVISANGSSLIILNGATGLQSDTLLKTSGVIRGTPQVVDINSDNSLEVIIASRKSYSGTTYGALYGWTNVAIDKKS